MKTYAEIVQEFAGHRSDFNTYIGEYYVQVYDKDLNFIGYEAILGY